MARLVCEPFNFTPSDIGDLTDKQISDICHYPRDKDGNLVARRQSVTPQKDGVGINGPDSYDHLTAEERKQRTWNDLRASGRALKVPEEKIREAWLKKYPEDAHVFEQQQR